MNRKDKLEQNMSPANRINVPERSCEQSFLQAADRMDQERRYPRNWAKYTPDMFEKAFAEGEQNREAVRKHNKRYNYGGLTVNKNDIEDY